MADMELADFCIVLPRSFVALIVVFFSNETHICKVATERLCESPALFESHQL